MLETMSQPTHKSERGSVQGADPLDATDFDLGEIDAPDEEPVADASIEPPAQAPDPAPEPRTEAAQPTVVTHQVLRIFNGAGLERLPGELVDASSWRTARSLEAMRYIAPVNPSEQPEVITTSDGRMWNDLDQAVRHEQTLVSTTAT